MKYTTLGKTDVKISRICLGTMTWGLQNTEAEGHEQMTYALSQGVNYWDTAEMYAIPPTPSTYGTTETIIGSWLAKHKKREEIVLASKISPLPWARGEANPTINRESLITAVDNSLKRLQTDYIDLYQFHWPTNRPNYHFDAWWDFEPSAGAAAKEAITANKIEILETCAELIQQGKIRHIGLSDDSAWGIKHFCDLAERHNLPRIVSIQNEYNLLRRRDETDVLETCALEEVSYLPWSPLEMGILSGKYLNGKRPASTRFTDEILGEMNKDRYKTRLPDTIDAPVQAYIDIANKHNMDVCQMAIAFTIRKPYMTSSIIGATSMAQLKNNIAAIDLNLSDEVLQEIEAVRRQYPVPF
ncbi:aldo/keto reductase [Francisellaceae bacterium]|nr:aldo/keto reductase [Francisellaceae bacterium]